VTHAAPRRKLDEQGARHDALAVVSTPRMLRFGTLIGVLAAACGGSSIAFSELDQALQQARCERLARCKLFPDEAACMAFFRIVLDASLTGAMAAHKVNYDGERAKQCVDATATKSCDLTAHDAHFEPAACSKMFTGTVAGGDSCSIDAECASGTCELPTDCPPKGCCVGTCRSTQSPAKAGGSCAKQRDCADGLVCGQDLTCRVPGHAGDPCGSDRECGEGLGCIGAITPMSGTCRVLPHVGEPCPYLRCAEENLRCDDTNTQSCVPLGLPGAPCPSSTECASGVECDATTHLCREYPTLGMPCDSICGGDSFCALDGTGAGMCVAPLSNTSPCDGYNQCASFYCEQGPVFDSCKEPYVCF
jgi:hypothetical protein